MLASTALRTDRYFLSAACVISSGLLPREVSASAANGRSQIQGRDTGERYRGGCQLINSQSLQRATQGP